MTLDDIFFSANNTGRNKLYLNQGNLVFKDITVSAGVSGLSEWSTGVSMVDINADGWLDIYICTVNIKGVFRSRNELYINNQNSTFTESAKEYGLDLAAHSTQATFFDYDKDGLLDCFILNHSTNFHESFRPAGNRNIVDSLSGDQLLHAQKIQHNGITKLKYFLVDPKMGAYYASPLSFGLGVAAGDVNNDGWLDIYATNDFREHDYCYLNKGNGTFIERATQLFGHHSRFSMGCDMADYNNDGRLDIVTLDMLPEDEKVLKSSLGEEFSDTYNYKRSFGFHNQYARNCLQTNLSNADSIHFVDVGLQAGIAATDWSWSPLLADFDNDGFKDLFITNGYLYRANDLDFNKFRSYELIKTKVTTGKTKFLDLLSEMPAGNYHDYIFKGTGQSKFIDKSAEWGFTEADLSHGAAYSDLDNDGDLDIIVNRMNQVAAIYENKHDPSATHHLSIELVGQNGNQFGWGCNVYAFTKGEFQMLQQMPVRGFMSSVSPVLHFGLGKHSTVDSLLIIWPSGRGDLRKNLVSNQRLKFLEKDAHFYFDRPLKSHLPHFKTTDVSKETNINVNTPSSTINDFANNPFILHKISTQGLKMAVADVNADGVDDLFIKSKIISGKDSSILFHSSATSQVVDALFFDADTDGDLDLITVSGGNQFYGNDDHLKDHLYVNDGLGKFDEDISFPALYENKSCVAVCDFDKDGDLDLFIGGRVNGRMYGMTPASNLLANNGEGKFSIVTDQLSPELSFVGMTTDAVWQDVDQDGWQDLIVVGEFMPITFFKNQHGKSFTKESFLSPSSTGLWNCITTADVDDDGDQDFLVGNWGNNSKLAASQKYPLKLFMLDFDNNGDMDPILAIAKQGKYYPFLGKEDLEKRLPILKKTYLKYGDMAGKTVSEVFGEKLKAARILEVSLLESVWLRNDQGSYSMHILPPSLQRAPIFSFTEIDENYFLATGNFYGTQPFEGRYDALPPTIFRLKVKEDKCVTTYEQFIFVRGEAMDVKKFKNRLGENVYLVARNDEPLMALRILSSHK
jgi:enediyne biosynthesis protein E4